MDEFVQAVQIALNPSSQAQLKQQATDYLEGIKNTPDGWIHCVERLFVASKDLASQQVKFVCLQIIQHAVLHHHGAFTQEQSLSLRTKLFAFYSDWIRNNEEEVFVRARFATLYASVIAAEYPEAWPSVFIDLLQPLGTSDLVVDMYLRILDAVHEEIISMEVPRSTAQRAVATLVKDSLREQCIGQLADAWYTVITTYATSQPKFVVAALKNLAAYVSWMDINLVACERFVHVFYQFLQVPEYQEPVCDVLLAMAIKGADPNEKIMLLHNLHLLDVLKGIKTTDVEFQTAIAKLLQRVVLELMAAHQELRLKEGADLTACDQLLDEFVTLTLQYTADEDDGVSEETLPAIANYTAKLSHKAGKDLGVTPARRQHIATITQILFNKFKFDPEFNFEQKDDEEIDFLDYRKSLSNILKLVNRVDSEAVKAFASQAVQAMVPNLEQMQFFDVEAVLYFVFVLGETFRSKMDDPIFPELIATLVKSNVSAFPHRAVSIMFLEVLYRYSRMATRTPELTQAVLTLFLDERGIRHPHPTVRARACYLFLRTVRTCKDVFAQHTNTIVGAFSDLLPIAVPGHTQPSLLEFDDQASLFEVIGLLVGASTSPEQQCNWLASIFGPLESQITDILNNQWYKTDTEDKPVVSTALSHLISAQAYVAKGLGGFPAHEALLAILNKTLDACFAAGNVLNDTPVVLSKVTFYLHTMIKCMSELFLNHAAAVIELVLKVNRIQVLTDLMRLVCQMITRYKDKVAPLIAQHLLAIIQHVVGVAQNGTPTDEDMQEVEQNDLRRHYYTFLQNLMQCCVGVFTDPQNVASLNEILNTVMQGTTESDSHIQHVAFSILTRSVDTWATTIPGFDQFILQAIVPACFTVPLASSFDLKDAADATVLGETVNTLRAILGRCGAEFLTYLTEVYLPQMQVPAELAQSYVTQLASSNVSFRKFLQEAFYPAMRARTT